MDVYVSDADESDPETLEIGVTGAEAAPADGDPTATACWSWTTARTCRVSGVYDLERTRNVVRRRVRGGPTGAPPDGKRFLAVRTREATKLPVVYGIETGDARELDLPAGVASFGRMGGDPILDGDRLLALHTTPTRRPELLTYDLATDETEPLVAAEYGPFSPNVFADAEYFTTSPTACPKRGRRLSSTTRTTRWISAVSSMIQASDRRRSS